MTVATCYNDVCDCCLVYPFLNEEDYQKTKQVVHEFEHGIGKELHNQLLQVAQNKQNWVWYVLFHVSCLDLLFRKTCFIQNVDVVNF